MKTYLSILIILMCCIISYSCKDSSTGGNTPEPTTSEVQASFIISGNLKIDSTITFNNTSKNATSYSWNFGDETTSTDQNPLHSYSDLGTYIVKLTAYNSDKTKNNIKEQNITITPNTVTVTSVALIMGKYNAGDWDNDLEGDWPDIYCKMFVGGNKIHETSPINNVHWIDLPKGFDINEKISDWNANITFQFWDKDDLSGDDEMGRTVGFNINNVIESNGYLPFVIANSADLNTTGTVFLAWH